MGAIVGAGSTDGDGSTSPLRRGESTFTVERDGKHYGECFERYVRMTLLKREFDWEL